MNGRKKPSPTDSDENGADFDLSIGRRGLKASLQIKGWRWWTALGAFISGFMAAAYKFGALLKEWLERQP